MSDNEQTKVTEAATQQSKPKKPPRKVKAGERTIKLFLPEQVALDFKSKATKHGLLLESAAVLAFEQWTAERPTDEQTLASVFRRHWPYPLFDSLDRARAASRLCWAQVSQLMAAALQREHAGQPTLTKPQAIPRPPMLPAVAPGFVPGTVVSDRSEDSGVRRAG